MERLMNEMVAMILQLNIEHYQRLLAEDIDESQRKTITRLLAEERTKLAAILKAEQRA